MVFDGPSSKPSSKDSAHHINEGQKVAGLEGHIRWQHAYFLAKTRVPYKLLKPYSAAQSLMNPIEL